MKYEEGKTYTLTGDETDYRGGTLRDHYAGIHFPVEAVFAQVDSYGDLTFHTKDDWSFYIKGNDEAVDTAEFDSVQRPEHYNTNLPEGVEAIDIIAAQIENLQGMKALCHAQNLKYSLRWQKKNGLEDLEKSVWYQQRLIEIIKKEKEAQNG